jgi:ADP-ribose pyrophosphatase YjhB (NUDIX family)
MNVRPAILIQKNGQILTLEYHYGGQIVYNLPGGNVDFGETMSQTLKREMIEELAMKVEVGELIVVGEVHIEEKNKSTLHCLFEGNIVEGEPTINAEHCSAKEIKWLNISDISSVNLYPNLKKEILQWINNQPLEDFYVGKIEQTWF